MRTIRTEIAIGRPAAAVWAILADIDRWPEWNPFATARGRLSLGERLDVEIRPPGGKPMAFRPTIVKLHPGVELRWLGHLGVPRIFDGEHGFRIEPTTPESCRFIHSEVFSGLLVAPLLWIAGDATRRGFESMNEALKARAEAT